MVLLCGLGLSVLYAGGAKDAETAVVADGAAFSETLDISGKKPGKYNFFVQARDQGGNTAVAGPHNMYIDPLSDLPVPRIINPHPGMRVSGNLNVVGACTDDDGVQWVDLIFNNDESTRVRAQGGKFFSYNYDTANLPDGLYSVTALAADTNGLEEVNGKRNISTVSWHLDRQPPEISLTSHETGALVHGRINIEGTVRDGNGVAGLEISIGEDGPFAPVRLRVQKKTGDASFSYTLDTTKLPNGPAIVRFRASDLQGSAGILTSLFSVDNNLPEVSLLYPQKEDGPVNGIFYAAGIARDSAGLASLSWELGKEKGDFELVTGNPYWAKQFDIRGLKAGSVDLVIRAVDRSGNTAVLKQKIQVDQKADLPRLTLTSPVTKTVVQGARIPLSGTVEDDDGLDGVYYSLNGGAPGLIPARGGQFQALLPAAANGVYSLKVWARDINGVESAPVEIKNLTLTASGGAGRFTLSLPEGADGAWVRNELSFAIDAGTGENPGALEYSADMGQTWQPLGGLRGTLPLNAFPDGYIGLLVRALDAGRNPSAPEDYLSFGVNKDTTPPEAFAVVPVAGHQVNGRTLLALGLRDNGRLQSVEFASGSGSRKSLDVAPFVSVITGNGNPPLSETMAFYITDAAGNRSTFNDWPFTIDRETDLPVAEINLPAEDQLVTRDFVISGIAYDDDQVARIWYRIDNGGEIALEAANSYTIPVKLDRFTDNEHTVTVSAEDIYGIRGAAVSRKFRVSRQEPRGWVDAPTQETINSGILEIRGGASDGNGLSRVGISLDNGYTYNVVPFTRAAEAGTVRWSYRFDTTVLKDGEYVAYIKMADAYGEQSLITALVNVDNTPPSLNLSSPPEAYTTGGQLVISGQVYDNTAVDRIVLSVRSVDGGTVPESLRRITIEPRPPLLFHELNLAALADGSYNLDIQALDKAANSSRFSRNISLVRRENLNSIECLSPLYGEEVRGSFNLSGIVRGNDRADTVTLRINGVDKETVPVNSAGYFSFTLDGANLSPGVNRLVVHSNFNGRGETSAPELQLNYSVAGPWLTVDSLAMGDFAYDRPWLSGRVGYALSAEDQAVLEDRKADKAARQLVAAKKVKAVDLSFDNGKTFVPVDLRGAEGWRFRIENEDMAAGSYHLLVRAAMVNGETAFTRTMVQIDTAPPVIRLLNPEPNGSYNQTLNVAALSSDDVQLGEVSYTLRAGDKNLYAVPGFLQGLYVEGHFWGATLWDAGMGLSFFDNNVKLQVQYGQLTQANYEMMGGEGIVRYGGDVLSAKLLANVYSLPFRSLFGPDWDWLSASVSLGAQFSLFSITQSGSPTWLTAFLGQLEFPRFTIHEWKRMKTFALYTELQVWFSPTDVDAAARGIPVLILQPGFGLRYYIF
jgi:hypothetical protein